MTTPTRPDGYYHDDPAIDAQVLRFVCTEGRSSLHTETEIRTLRVAPRCPIRLSDGRLCWRTLTGIGEPVNWKPSDSPAAQGDVVERAKELIEDSVSVIHGLRPDKSTVVGWIAASVDRLRELVAEVEELRDNALWQSVQTGDAAMRAEIAEAEVERLRAANAQIVATAEMLAGERVDAQGTINRLEAALREARHELARLVTADPYGDELQPRVVDALAAIDAALSTDTTGEANDG